MTHPSVAGLAGLPEPVAWVFGGSGARGAAQVGMAEVLLEQGLRPDLLVGSGTGALNAAALVDATVHLQRLRATWRTIGSDSVLASLGSAAVRAFSPRRTGRSSRELRDLMAQAVPGDPDRPIPDHLILVASDLASGAAVVVTEGSIREAVAAAAAVPVIVQPVVQGDEILVDGSLTAAAPLDQALAAGARAIVLLDTGASAIDEDTVAGLRWWQVASLAYSHQVRGQLGHALMRTAPVVPVVVVTCAAGGQWDFGDPDEQFAAGRSAASHALAHGLGADVGGPGLYGVPQGYQDDPRLVDLLR